MLFIFLLIIAALLIIGLVRKPATIESRPWFHFYDDINLSTKEFYQAVTDGVKRRKVPMDFSEESFLESHIFSARRAYLRITKAEYVFYVCAAPFGTGTFVSWWLCVKDENFLNRIPLVSRLIGKDRKNKTFYQMDTETMFRSTVHSAVIETADAFTADKGFRLSEHDRVFAEPHITKQQAN